MTKKRKLDVDNILNSNNSNSDTLESQHFNELSCRSTEGYLYFNKKNGETLSVSKQITFLSH